MEILKTSAEIIVAIFGIIGGLYAAYMLLNKKLKSRRDAKDKYFSGYWSNEGNIINNLPSHYLDLHLFCGKRKLTGTFNVRKREELNAWRKATIMGSRRKNAIHCNVNILEDGKIIGQGIVLLVNDEKKSLKWISGDISEYFPVTAVLKRSLPLMA